MMKLAAAAITLLLGGCTGEPATPRPQDQPRTTMSPTNDFTLVYSERRGPELGEGLREYENRIRIDGMSSTASLSSCRASSDDQGLPIGSFSMTLDSHELTNLFQNATGINLGNLPRPRGGAVGASLIELQFQSGSTSWRKSINSHDRTTLSHFRALFDPLNRIHGRLYSHPTEALRVSLRRDTNGFLVVLENIGRTDLAVLDPRPLGATHLDAWAGMLVAEFPPVTPGITPAPLRWKQVALEVPSHDSAIPRRSSVLAASETMAWRVQRWTPTAPGRHIARAVLVDYEGPAAIDGVPRLRGAVFSEGLEFTP